MDLRCKQCGRWLGKTEQDCDLEFKCGNCKTNNRFNIQFHRNPYGENACVRAKLETERSERTTADADGQMKAADKDNPDNQRSESNNE